MKWGITDEQNNEILKFISENQYCGIIAPTGSGKSTAMIQNIYEKGSATVFVTQPTIPAAKSLYKEMAKRLGDDKVGFAAEGTVQYTRYTPIVYCTAGHLRRKMLNYFENGLVKDGAIDFCTVIVLDEAHNGSLDNDIITELWIQAVKQGAEVPRLVLASATLSKESTVFEDLPIYELPTRSMKVDIEYASKDYTPDNKNLYIDMSIAVLTKHINNPVPENDVSKWLVFCAGSREVEDVCSIIREAELEKVLIFPVYSSLPDEQRAKITSDIPLGHRAIFVATNIVEASLTIDGLDGVFDSLTEKVGETSSSGGLRLVVKHISKSSASQRKGRTGRTRPGFCFRMCTPRFFETLTAQREPEIARVPLTNVSIEFINVGLDPVALFKGRVSQQRIKDTIDLLKSLEMIDKKNKVTELGTFVTMFPLGVRNSAMIYNWMQLKKKDGSPYAIYPIIVLTCLIDSYNPWYYYIPKKSEDYTVEEYNKFKNKYFKEKFGKYESNSDLKTLLLMWNDLINNFKTLKPNYDELFQWSFEHSLNNKKIQEVLKVIKQCCEKISNDNDVIIPIGTFNEDIFLKLASKVLTKSYGDNIYDMVKDGVYINKKNKVYYKMDNQQKLNPSLKYQSKKIIGLITREIVLGGKYSNNIISLSFPIN